MSGGDAVRDQLASLYELQRLDARVLELQRAAEQIPLKVAELERAPDGLRNELGAWHNEVDASRVAQTDAEASIREEQAKVQKWKRRLNEIKTPREYQALAREVEQTERLVRDLEEKVVGFMDAIEQKEALIKEHETSLREAEAEISGKVRELRFRQAQLSTEAAEIRQGRDAILAKLPKAVLTRYERVRDRRPGTAVALMQGSTCSGCNVQVRPQLVVEIRKLNTIEQCPLCSRILVLESLVKGEG